MPSPSLIEQLGMNMLLLRGEECHQEGTDEADAGFHIVGLGHTVGVTDAMRRSVGRTDATTARRWGSRSTTL